MPAGWCVWYIWSGRSFILWVRNIIYNNGWADSCGRAHNLLCMDCGGTGMSVGVIEALICGVINWMFVLHVAVQAQPAQGYLQRCVGCLGDCCGR